MGDVIALIAVVLAFFVGYGIGWVDGFKRGIQPAIPQDTTKENADGVE